MGFFRVLTMVAVGGAPLLLTGCQGESYPIVPVEGTLVKAGKPMGNMKVEFYPERESGVIGPRSHGVTDDKGWFRLQTDAGEDGAVVGKHRIVLVDVDYLERTAPIPADHPIALKHKGKGPPVNRVAKESAEYFLTPLRSEVTPPRSTLTVEMK